MRKKLTIAVITVMTLAFTTMRRFTSPILVLIVIGSACASGSDEGVEQTPTTAEVPTTTATMPPATTTTPAPATTTTSTSTTTLAEPRFTLTELSSEQTASSVVGAADPLSRPVVAYWSADDQALKLLRCSEPNCVEPPEIITLGSMDFPEPIDLALRPDGSPIVVVQPYDRDHSMVYACTDPACTKVEASEFSDPEPCTRPDGRPCQFSVDFPKLAMAPDGLPRIAYFAGWPAKLKLAICQDPACTSASRITIDEEIADHGRPSLRIDPSGRVLIGYESAVGYDSEARVAVCDDASCTTPATILVFDQAAFPRTMPGPGGDLFVWYRTGASSLPGDLITSEDFWTLWSDYSDIMVATCSSAGCSEAQVVEAGEDWLRPWGGSLEWFMTADGGMAAFFNHESQATVPDIQLHLIVCSDVMCTEAETRPLGLEDVSAWQYDAIADDNRPPRVVFASEQGGIHLLTCSSQTCAAAQ